VKIISYTYELRIREQLTYDKLRKNLTKDYEKIHRILCKSSPRGPGLGSTVRCFRLLTSPTVYCKLSLTV